MEQRQTPPQAQRIQTSLINTVEKKVLVWIAKRQPLWVTSDMLTVLGSFGAFLTGLGFWLTRYGVDWLWLSSAGLIINWYGDSLDGTLARVRNCQRPIYGFYIDHTVDCVNEAIMFIGAGLSPLVNLNFTLITYILYLLMTINVSINAHLKSEFRLTYAKLGPTEFRLLIILVNILLVACPTLAFNKFEMVGQNLSLFDLIVLFIIVVLSVIYTATIISDIRQYAKIDPPKNSDIP